MKTMVDKRTLFLDTNLRCGGFYELCIQVCPSIEPKPVYKYDSYIWSLPNVEGPYDHNFSQIALEEKPWMEYQGILNLENYSIPFKTINIKEDEPIETGFNWFDICFYTEAIEQVFGREYNTWEDIPKPPELLKGFLLETVSNLYKEYSFELGLIGFEVSGQYYLDDLKKKLSKMYFTEFFVGKEKLTSVLPENKKEINVI